MKPGTTLDRKHRFSEPCVRTTTKSTRVSHNCKDGCPKRWANRCKQSTRGTLTHTGEAASEVSSGAIPGLIARFGLNRGKSWSPGCENERVKNESESVEGMGPDRKPGQDASNGSSVV